MCVLETAPVFWISMCQCACACVSVYLFPPPGWLVSSCLDICWVLFHWDINPAGQLLGQLLSVFFSGFISVFHSLTLHRSASLFAFYFGFCIFTLVILCFFNQTSLLYLFYLSLMVWFCFGKIHFSSSFRSCASDAVSSAAEVAALT